MSTYWAVLYDPSMQSPFMLIVGADEVNRIVAENTTKSTKLLVKDSRETVTRQALLTESGRRVSIQRRIGCKCWRARWTSRCGVFVTLTSISVRWISGRDAEKSQRDLDVSGRYGRYWDDKLSVHSVLVGAGWVNGRCRANAAHIVPEDDIVSLHVGTNPCHGQRAADKGRVARWSERDAWCQLCWRYQAQNDKRIQER